MLIKIKNLSKTYRPGKVEVTALHDISLNIASNEYVAIMGPSGSGKSTLMNIIGCLDRPTGGIFDFDGERVADMDDKQLSAMRNRKIGFVFQTFNLMARTTALKNVELPLLYSNIPRQQRIRQSMAALAEIGLGDRASHKPEELSGGQRQRVAIARALVNKPSVLLADEPTGSLDSKATTEIMETMRQLHEQGNTIIVVTHEESVAKHADRIVRLRDGRIESDKPKQ